MTLPFVIMGCQDETERITLDSPQDTMGLKVSSSDVVLNQDLGNEEAISFTWGSAANRGEGTKLTYYFKMDMADNNFETSIAKVEIPEGVQSISYTHKEMNALLSGWKVTAGETAMLEAEIIAEVSGGSVYMKPEISKVQFSVTGYYIEPRDLFIVGTAVEEMDAAALKMKEVISEQKYEWGGHLKQGDFKFIKSRTSLTPSYTKGADDNTLVYNETDDGTETLFHIDKDGYYFITVDVEKLTIASEYPESIYEKVWAIGDATPAGWQPFSAVPLTKINNIQFVYEGDLYAGELKFPLELDENYYMSYLMPKTHGTEPGGDNTMEYVEKEKAKTHDYKWKITESQTGIYKIILDTYLMEITFEKKHDLPIKAVWMTGSATATQWNTPFEIAFNSDEKEGTFVWEGHLNTGEIKFPLSNTNGFECDYLMPEENGTSVTDAKKMVRKNYPDTTDENDHKWKVEEAGEYKISLNVIDMTVKFEKLY